LADIYGEEEVHGEKRSYIGS